MKPLTERTAVKDQPGLIFRIQNAGRIRNSEDLPAVVVVRQVEIQRRRFRTQIHSSPSLAFCLLQPRAADRSHRQHQNMIRFRRQRDLRVQILLIPPDILMELKDSVLRIQLIPERSDGTVSHIPQTIDRL